MGTAGSPLRAVFLDRDGVLNDLVDRGPEFRALGLPVRWTAPFSRSELRIRHNVRDALWLVGEKGYRRILVTNQPDVAAGRIDADEFRLMMDEVLSLPLDDVFVCMHAPGDGCSCRKPAPGMILAACAKHGINPRRSYMVGDSESDIQAGRAAGTKTMLVSSNVYVMTAADRRVMNFMEAAQLIPRRA